MHEQYRRLQPGKMLRAKLRPPGGMQRIREQEQAVAGSGFLCCQHAGLASAIGLAAQEHFLRAKLPDNAYSILQTFSIERAVSRRWPMRPRLPEREITPQNQESRRSEELRKRHQ